MFVLFSPLYIYLLEFIVYPDGRVCISILHTPDPMNTDEREEETWRPILTVESILVSVCSMLSDPNFSSPANVDASVSQLIIYPFCHLSSSVFPLPCFNFTIFLISSLLLVVLSLHPIHSG